MTDVSIAISHREPVGVVIAAYTNKLSRMFHRNLRTDEFTPGQFLQSYARAIDVSFDGKYLTYYAEGHHRRSQTYIAVSHIPYFTALAFFPALHVTFCTAYFGDAQTLLVHAERHDLTWVEGYDQVQERIEEGSPFNIVRKDLLDASHKGLGGKLGECSYTERRFAAMGASLYDVTDSGNNTVPRLIRAFEAEEFEEIPTPDWACKW